MEVTALCIRLLMTMLTLRCSFAQKNDATLYINPNRLQFLKYESVTFHCGEFDGSPEWKISYEVQGEIPNCETNKVETMGLYCRIKNVYLEDSGAYWCEAAGGRRSNSINITVTAGSVILESPALPVMEGNPVILRCRNKTTSTNFPADFYKDGLFIRSSSIGEMIIYSVSKSDEGLYKCKISGAGESTASWLAVKESPPCSCTAPWIIVTFLLVVLLVVVGIQYFGKGYWLRDEEELSPGPGAVYYALDETQQLESSAANEDKSIYASVKKNRKKGAAWHQRVTVESSAADADQPTYASATKNNEEELSPGSGTVYSASSLDEAQQLESSAANEDKSIYASVKKNRKKAETGASSITTGAVLSTDTNPHSAEDASYSTIE